METSVYRVIDFLTNYHEPSPNIFKKCKRWIKYKIVKNSYTMNDLHKRSLHSILIYFINQYPILEKSYNLFKNPKYINMISYSIKPYTITIRDNESLKYYYYTLIFTLASTDKKVDTYKFLFSNRDSDVDLEINGTKYFVSPTSTNQHKDAIEYCIKEFLDSVLDDFWDIPYEKQNTNEVNIKSMYISKLSLYPNYSMSHQYLDIDVENITHINIRDRDCADIFHLTGVILITNNTYVINRYDIETDLIVEYIDYSSDGSIKTKYNPEVLRQLELKQKNILKMISFNLNNLADDWRDFYEK